MAVLQGKTPAEIADEQMLTHESVINWINVRENPDIDNFELFGTRILQRRQKLTAHQVKWLYFVLTTMRPNDLRIESAFWTRNILQSLIREHCVPRFHNGEIYILLEELGFIFDHPILAVPKTNHDAKAWIKTVLPAVRETAKRQKASLFYLGHYELTSCFKIFSPGLEQDGCTIVRTRGTGTGKHVFYAYDLVKKAVRFEVQAGEVCVEQGRSFVKRIVNLSNNCILLAGKNSVFARDEIRHESADSETSLFIAPI